MHRKRVQLIDASIIDPCLFIRPRSLVPFLLNYARVMSGHCGCAFIRIRRDSLVSPAQPANHDSHGNERDQEGCSDTDTDADADLCSAGKTT
jgi:hypothetical protein